jgi:hypothetical protein
MTLKGALVVVCWLDVRGLVEVGAGRTGVNFSFIECLLMLVIACGVPKVKLCIFNEFAWRGDYRENKLINLVAE